MGDAADKATADTERAMELLEEQLRRDRIDQAEPRPLSLEETCIDCIGPIEPERLRTLRNTSRCAACAHTFERSMKPHYRVTA